ncbi:MAG TPA: hypothetical protein PLN54_14065, partial [Flavobacteriales bacterium]|nr:hypothetical protein [Flavobacteriales bacterium]
MPVRSSTLLRNLYIAIGVGALLYLGRYVLIPLAYGLLVALVLYPLVARLESRGVPRWAAITLGLLLVGVVFGLLMGVLLYQVNSFLADLPMLTG